MVPLVFHTLLESGVKSSLRYLRQQLSLSLLFSVFATQVWARSFLSTSAFGQARYVQTDRLVEVSRRSFSFLFENYNDLSLAVGMSMLGGLLYNTLSQGANTSVIFYWITVPPLVLVPFLFNPHQFRFLEFAVDYKSLLEWFGYGNKRSNNHSKDSWIAYHRRQRAVYTGYTSDPHSKEGSVKDTRRRAFRSVIWLHEIVYPVLIAVMALMIYSVGSGNCFDEKFFFRIFISIFLFFS